MLLAQRDPIVTAKAIASLDVLSGGRVLLGIGAGWNIEEMEDHGVDPERRFGRMRESVEAMRALWREDEASFAGEQIAFAPAWSWPKPVQPGGPPVLVGGNGKRVLERVVRYGDAWYRTSWATTTGCSRAWRSCACSRPSKVAIRFRRRCRSPRSSPIASRASRRPA